MKYNKKFFLILFLILSIIFVFTDRFFCFNIIDNSFNYIIVEYQKYASISFSFIKNNFNVITNVFEIENQNIELKSQIEEFKLKDEYYKNIEIENKKLKYLLKIKDELKTFELTAAKVVSKDENLWFDIFIIDKGTQDKIKKNMIVLNNGAVVGRIIESKRNFSKVKSLIDPSSSVSIKDINNDEIGFVKGDLELKRKGLCKLEFLHESDKIKIGDEIVTSQLSDIFFSGLSIGKIIKINDKDIILKPGCNLKNIEYVLIINKKLDIDLYNQENNFGLNSQEN